MSLKYKLNQILSKKISRAFTKQKYFEFGDKPHKLLARQLRKMENDRTIHKIKNENGHLCTTQGDLNDQFRQLYEGLYSSKSNSGPRDMQEIWINVNCQHWINMTVEPSMLKLHVKKF